jgi:hypothetical protein
MPAPARRIFSAVESGGVGLRPMPPHSIGFAFSPPARFFGMVPLPVVSSSPPETPSRNEDGLALWSAAAKPAGRRRRFRSRLVAGNSGGVNEDGRAKCLNSLNGPPGSAA